MMNLEEKAVLIFLISSLGFSTLVAVNPTVYNLYYNIIMYFNFL